MRGNKIMKRAGSLGAQLSIDVAIISRLPSPIARLRSLQRLHCFPRLAVFILYSSVVRKRQSFVVFFLYFSRDD